MSQKSLFIANFAISVILSLLFLGLFIPSSIDETIGLEKYCSVILEPSTYPADPEQTYVLKSNGSFRPFNPDLDREGTSFFIQRQGSEFKIEDANWVSQGVPCKLKVDEILKEFTPPFLIMVMIFYVLLIMLSLVFFFPLLTKDHRAK